MDIVVGLCIAGYATLTFIAWFIFGLCLNEGSRKIEWRVATALWVVAFPLTIPIALFVFAIAYVFDLGVVEF